MGVQLQKLFSYLRDGEIENELAYLNVGHFANFKIVPTLDCFIGDSQSKKQQLSDVSVGFVFTGHLKFGQSECPKETYLHLDVGTHVLARPV